DVGRGTRGSESIRQLAVDTLDEIPGEADIRLEVGNTEEVASLWGGNWHGAAPERRVDRSVSGSLPSHTPILGAIHRRYRWMPGGPQGDYHPPLRRTITGNVRNMILRS